ncbi:hypothetical protein KIW84_062079 [Lathyrus oleraceus]|uniref:Uncharacterized protein n=1 Tax=Pisum sativum TaxID=3888 RepID=A0A9D4W7N4_PEA|nr:hypothetical protein KIW84_062079 [Pisum sativum]
MLVEKDNLWYGLLTSRYGDLNYRILANSVEKLEMAGKHCWIGANKLASIFPDLRDVISLLEQVQLDELNYILVSVHPTQFGEDTFVWKNDVNGFSTVSSYKRINSYFDGGTVIEPLMLKGLANVWKSKVLSKVQLFGWRTLLNR